MRTSTESHGLARGLTETAEALASGAVSSTALVTEALAAIEASQPSLNAFKLVRSEAALAEAAAADERLTAGETAPLLGVPVAIKDDTDLAGTPTAFGCPGSFEPAERDSEAVRKLRAAGAIVLGKTNTPELGQWPFTEGPAFGATRNPWNTEHTPGGSSGGSAAAVAAGLVPAALGSDGAGSVRIPAAWTNLVGIKPQRGRISSMPDPEAFEGLTVLGPLARTVSDAALLLDVVSGSHPAERHHAAPIDALAASQRESGKLRIAVSTHTAYAIARARLDGEIERALRSIAETTGELGHEVTEDHPDYGLIGLDFLPRASTGVADWVHRAGSREYDPRTLASARAARAIPGAVRTAARLAEPLLHKRIGRFFERYDVLLTPTTASPPPRIGAFDGLSEWATNKAMVTACPYAWPWNVLGWPGVNIPAGFTEDGLPIGVQLLGGPNSEPTLLSLAAALERELRWYERSPRNDG